MSESSTTESSTSGPTRRDPTMSRRGLLRAGGATAVGGVALSAADTASAQSDDYDGWLGNVGNYDGTVVDETGSDGVTIEVGAQGNGGPYAFSPPAVKVSPGTTVTWKWVEGYHNVVDDAGAFESKQTGEAGFTFEQTFDEPGVTEYFCAPHETMGMKGVVDVVSGGGGGASEQLGENTDAMGSSGDGTVGGLVVAGLAAAFLSPALFATFLRNRDVGDGSDRGQ